MDHVIDLDQAAAEITARLPTWTTSGHSPGPLTWRDGQAPWPQRLETNRTLVADPDSVGLRILGADAWSELQIVLYRGGWADVDALTADEVVTEGPRVVGREEFGDLLDSAVTRFLGPGRQPTGG
ncbi:hypothetical protein [Streptomyces sp. NBC_01233]|uniref:hypothetical protein n=1 Tax=Streptomyces sp. NBC_01233 TaxID=2903787 RepID=UPI002E11118A|nr:hypothetical protein OG332_03575 [Streptomyces sp. NBC_01233]